MQQLLDPHHQIIQWHIKNTHWWCLTPLQRCSRCILQLQTTGLPGLCYVGEDFLKLKKLCERKNNFVLPSSREQRTVLYDEKQPLAEWARGKERERERERESKQTERQRQRQSQRERERERATDRQTERQRNRERPRERMGGRMLYNKGHWNNLMR